MILEILYAVHHLLGAALVQRYRDGRVLLAEGVHDGGHEVAGVDLRGPDSDLTALQLAQLAYRVLGFIRSCEDALGVFEEDTSGLRELHRAADPLEEAHSVVHLERLDVLAHRGLGDKEDLRSRAVAALPGGDVEDAKLVEVQEHGLSSEAFIPDPAYISIADCSISATTLCRSSSGVVSDSLEAYRTIGASELRDRSGRLRGDHDDLRWNHPWRRAERPHSGRLHGSSGTQGPGSRATHGARRRPGHRDGDHSRVDPQHPRRLPHDGRLRSCLPRSGTLQQTQARVLQARTQHDHATLRRACGLSLRRPQEDG